MSEDSFDALCARAIAAAQRGRLDEACSMLESALAQRPNAVAALCNLGTLLNALGRFGDALPRFVRACELSPSLAEAWNGRGGALLGAGRYDEAIEGFDRALALDPRDALARYNRSLALFRLGRAGEALAGFDEAVALAPKFGAALNNRGLCLARLDRHEDALASFDRALLLDPGNPDVPYNRGQSLRSLGRLDDALAAYDRAIALVPGFAKAHNNRGGVQKALGQYEDALASFDRALALDPAFAEARFNRGALLSHLDRGDEAVAELEQSRDLAPDLPYVLGTLGYARLRSHRWDGLLDIVGDVTAAVRAGRPACDPFVFLALSDDAQDQLACARAWARGSRPAIPAHAAGERLRVAYVSADLRDHPVGHLMAGVLERHDRARFDVTAVGYGTGAPDAIQARIRSACERFVDVHGMTDAAAAARMRELRIDIAVDLTGLTHEGRPGIFANRAAPVQVGYLGYPGTSGCDYLDYILADEFVIPPDREDAYTENVVRLPETFQANGASRQFCEPLPSRASEGLPEGATVLCSFNSAYKLHPAMFAAWMRVLHRVENAVLWLLGGSGEARLREAAVAHGIDPSRLVFAPRVMREHYLARYRLADLFLDTHPYNAGTTASDALWAGLPVLTLAGDAFASRMAGSLLHTAGLPELVTASLDGYESAAARLASDRTTLASLRERLERSNEAGPLFDTLRFAGHLEAAYAAMQLRCVAGLPPAPFSVPMAP